MIINELMYEQSGYRTNDSEAVIPRVIIKVIRQKGWEILTNQN